MERFRRSDTKTTQIELSRTVQQTRWGGNGYTVYMFYVHVHNKPGSHNI